MKPLIKWRHQYDTDADTREGDGAALHCRDESLTQQSFTEDADLNVIARRFGLETIPLGRPDASHFRDTTNDPELADILNAQRIARDHFMALPGKLRKRFHDNPQELWDFVNDPENAEEALRLNILARIPEGGAIPAPTAQSATSSSATKESASLPSDATEQPPKSPPAQA